MDHTSPSITDTKNWFYFWDMKPGQMIRFFYVRLFYSLPYWPVYKFFKKQLHAMPCEQMSGHFSLKLDYNPMLLDPFAVYRKFDVRNTLIDERGLKTISSGL